MKFGETFALWSRPEWRSYNVDYNEIKRLIKKRTVTSAGNPIVLPPKGEDARAVALLQDELYEQLVQEHERVGFFVKAKAMEVQKKLETLEKQLGKMILRASASDYEMNEKRIRRVLKIKAETAKLREDINALKIFIGAQRLAFQKILKKFQKWTASSEVVDRFDLHILHMPTSFTKFSFKGSVACSDRIMAVADEVLPKDANGNPLTLDALSQGNTSPSGGSTTDGPNTGFESTTTLITDSTYSSLNTSSRDSGQKLNDDLEETKASRYWNEYDDGEEAPPEEAYTVEVGEDSEFFKKISAKIFFLFGKNPESEDEESSLLQRHEWDSQPPDGIENFSYGTIRRSRGHARRTRERELAAWKRAYYIRAIIGSYVASLLLFAIVLVLIATGRKKFKAPVDVFTFVGVLASLSFLVVGGLYSFRLRSHVAQFFSALFFIATCAGNGAVLAILIKNVENAP